MSLKFNIKIEKAERNLFKKEGASPTFKKFAFLGLWLYYSQHITQFAKSLLKGCPCGLKNCYGLRERERETDRQTEAETEGKEERETPCIARD
jgi:hypothetical protein